MKRQATFRKEPGQKARQIWERLAGGKWAFECVTLSDFVIGIATGYVHSLSVLREGELVTVTAHSLLEALGVITTLFALRSSGMIWGDANISHGRSWFHVCSCCAWLVLLCSAQSVSMFDTRRGMTGWAGRSGILVSSLLIWASLMVAIRGKVWLLVSTFMVMANVMVLVVVTIRQGYFLIPGPMIKTFVSMLVSPPTRYVHHQRLACCIAFQPLVAYYMGIYFHRLTDHEWHSLHGSYDLREAFTLFVILSFFGAVVVYSNLMLRRKQRRLPPGLARAKFVRLGYLRSMLARGEQICRCQDLPAEAFGDASLAAHIIIVTHRWLDPLCCDVCTPTFPQGVKLDRLVARCDEHFSRNAIRISHGFWPWLSALHRAYCIGGWDVVLFLDFCSIPQRKKMEDGSIQQRNPDEQMIFDECLPNMGTLYSTFPVLILKDVPEDDTEHSYIDSGWCSCELAISMLGQTLDSYSKDELGFLMRRSHIDISERNMSEDLAAEFEERTRQDVQAKHFLHDSDRKVALGIIQGFRAKRVLLDAVLRKDLEVVRRHLTILSGRGLLQTLDEPVDHLLNTLLHVAVQTRYTEIICELLRHGANPSLRNMMGDTPSQWCLFPRWSSAAALCRNTSSSSQENDASLVDGMKIFKNNNNGVFLRVLVDDRDSQILGKSEGTASEPASGNPDASPPSSTFQSEGDPRALLEGSASALSLGGAVSSNSLVPGTLSCASSYASSMGFNNDGEEAVDIANSKNSCISSRGVDYLLPSRCWSYNSSIGSVEQEFSPSGSLANGASFANVEEPDTQAALKIVCTAP